MEDKITPKAAIEFLEEAVNYFSKRPTGGEDQAHWSNVYNADNCKRVAELIKSMDDDINSTPKNPMEVYFEAARRLLELEEELESVREELQICQFYSIEGR